MTSSRSSIPDKWKPAFERYQEQIESHLVHGGAWLMLVTVSLYHVSHTYFHVHEADLGQNELLLRLPLLAATVLALSSHWLGLPRWPARYFLRLMGLGLSGMALSLLFLFARYEPLMVSQVSDAMTIALFGATVLSLRNFKEWLLIVLLPILLFCIAAVVADLPLLTLLGVFIGPALIMLVTNILMALARIVDAEGFIARERLREMATTDPLTGLLNRRAFMPLVQQEQARAQRSGTPFSVILADLDKFKRVNDTWGHETGDQVLQKTAELLQSSLRQQDALCRWGGEEFLILLPETDAQGAMNVAEKCRVRLANTPLTMGSSRHPQTISLGVAVADGTEATELLINRADGALYLAKERGRNRSELAGPEQ